MRNVITSLLIVCSITATGLAFQARNGGAAGACGLLPRDLVVKILPEARKKELDREKPKESPLAEDLRQAGQQVKAGTICEYGPVMLKLEPEARPADTLASLRTRTKGYQDFEPVAGVGDAAFVRPDRYWASMYVWTGSRHFLVELGAAVGEDGRQLKPNVIELAKGIAAQLR